MTLGQRIAQKRKELGLSQEALGEQLGVSRQAIYKWESDASLPEIEKLVALSRVFSVTVGWLLGVEEPPEGQGEAPPAGELTGEQLAMVEEIVSRYLAAQPRPMSKRRRRIWKFALAAAAVCLVAGLYGMSARLEGLSRDYGSLRNSIQQVSSQVDSQISSITGRVEDILKSQNELTAEWSTQLVSTDLAANTATFSVRAVPKTYAEGMTALLVAESGGERVEVPVEPGEALDFSGEVTCPLTNDISLSVVFLQGNQRQTQWLEDYRSLYADTFPDLYIHGGLWRATVEDGVLDPEQYPGVDVDSVALDVPVSVDQLRVGLFRDRELVAWYTPREREVLVNGTPMIRWTWDLPEEVDLEPGYLYSEAAVYTDGYGRQRVYEDAPPVQYDTRTGEWDYVDNYQLSSDPADWKF